MAPLWLKPLTWTFVFWLMTSAATSEETLFLVSGDFPPFSGKSLPQGGMTTEITVKAFKEMGYQAQIEFEPWKRGFTNTSKLLYFGTFPYVKDNDRVKDFLFSQPIYSVKAYFFVRSDFNKPFKNMQDLKGLTACLPVGYSSDTIQQFLDKELITIGMRPSNDAACFRALSKRRVDLYGINVITGWDVIKKTFGHVNGFKTIGTSLLPAHYCIMVNKQYPNAQKLLNTFNEGLTRLKERGAYQDIVKRHLAY